MTSRSRSGAVPSQNNTLPGGSTDRSGRGRRARESQPPIRCRRSRQAETTRAPPRSSSRLAAQADLVGEVEGRQRDDGHPPSVRRGQQGCIERQRGVPLAARRHAALASERQRTAERRPPVRRQSADTHAKRNAARQAYVPRTVEKTLLRRARVRIARKTDARFIAPECPARHDVVRGRQLAAQHGVHPGRREPLVVAPPCASTNRRRSARPTFQEAGCWCRGHTRQGRPDEGRPPASIRLARRRRASDAARGTAALRYAARTVRPGRGHRDSPGRPRGHRRSPATSGRGRSIPGTGPARLEAHRPRSVDEEETGCVRLPVARCRP